MSWDSLPLIGVALLLCWVFYAFARERFSPDVVVGIAVAVLLVSQLLLSARERMSEQDPPKPPGLRVRKVNRV